MKDRGLLLLAATLLSGCAALTESASLDTASDPCAPPTLLLSISGGDGEIGPTTVPDVAGVAPPLTMDEPRAFNLTSTIPLKIRVEDCGGNPVNSLSPSFTLEQVDPAGGVVNVIVSSSEVDVGTMLRPSGQGNGQYLFDLSTKLSGFVSSGDLTAGLYRLTVSSPGDFEDLVVEFTLR